MLDCFNFFTHSCFLATVWQFVFKWHKQFIKVSIYMFCLTALQRLCISFSSFIQKNNHCYSSLSYINSSVRYFVLLASFDRSESLYRLKMKGKCFRVFSFFFSLLCLTNKTTNQIFRQWKWFNRITSKLSINVYIEVAKHIQNTWSSKMWSDKCNN